MYRYKSIFIEFIKVEVNSCFERVPNLMIWRFKGIKNIFMHFVNMASRVHDGFDMKGNRCVIVFQYIANFKYEN
jgi:hypothetical protein